MEGGDRGGVAEQQKDRKMERAKLLQEKTKNS